MEGRLGPGDEREMRMRGGRGLHPIRDEDLGIGSDGRKTPRKEEDDRHCGKLYKHARERQD